MALESLRSTTNRFVDHKDLSFKAELMNIYIYMFLQASRSIFLRAVTVITSKSKSGDNNLSLSCL